MLKYKNMIITALSFAFLVGCNKPEPVIVPAEDFGTITKEIYDNSTQSGKLWLTVKDTILQKSVTKLPTLPIQAPVLNSLKNTLDATQSTQPFRMIAIGGSLSAGVRDGGLFLDAQQTAFPNLIARQMKLENFKQPLFGENEFNGLEQKVITNRNPLDTKFAHYVAVKNNLALKTTTPTVLLNKYIGEVDNFSTPFLHSMELQQNSFISEEFFKYEKARPNFAYWERMAQNTANIKNTILNQKADFITICLGFDDAIWWSLNGKGGIEYVSLGIVPPMYELLQGLQKKGVKACIANVPDVLKLPYFNQIKYDDVVKANPDKQLIAYERGILENGFIFLPKESIDSLISTKNKSLKRGSFEYPVLDKDVLSIGEINKTKKDINSFNSLLSTWGKEFSYPIVDLFSLYEQIASGNYTTADGVKVNPSFPNSNFFSQDGIHPTPLGQAIIANEYIKTINQFYKLNISLVPTKELLTK